MAIKKRDGASASYEVLGASHLLRASESPEGGAASWVGTSAMDSAGFAVTLYHTLTRLDEFIETDTGNRRCTSFLNYGQPFFSLVQKGVPYPPVPTAIALFSSQSHRHNLSDCHLLPRHGGKAQ